MTTQSTQDQSSRSFRRWGYLAGGFHLKPLLALVALLLALVGAHKVSAATYFSAASGNWSANSTWGTGSSGQGAPAGPPVAGDTANIRPSTVTVSANAACTTLTVGSGSSASVQKLTFNGAYTLTVSGNMKISSSSSRPGNLTMGNSGATVAVGGSFTIWGEISNPTKTVLDMSAGGTLKAASLVVAGSSTANIVYTPGGTVELTADNTLPTSVLTSFNNLTLSGGTKTTTLGAAIAISGDLKFASTSEKMNLGTYASTANTLWINGVQQAAGVWGPTGSGAEHESDSFTGSTGRMTVTAGAGCTTPSAPTGLTATTPTVGQVHLAWTAPGETVTGYKIYRSTSSGTETLYASPPGTGTTYDDTGVTTGTHYYYKVTAVNGACESGLSGEADAIVHGSYWSGATGNWSSPSTWAIVSGGTPVGYGPPIVGDNVYIRNWFVVTVDGSRACANLSFSSGSSAAYLTFSGVNPSLNVTTRLDVGNAGTGNSTYAGVLTFTSDATVTAGQCYLNKQIKDGVTKSTINMAAGGKLVAGLLGTAGGAGPTDYVWTPGAGTVELNANNTLPATVWTTFNNLTLSGATTTTLSTGIAIGGKLEIGASAAMNLGTYASTADSLWIDGVLQPAGEWGSVGSGAANTSARFTGTSGRMIVATGAGCTPPAAPTGNASQSFCGSPTVANLAATGTSIQWYAASSDGSPLSAGTALVNGTHYYASQTVVCESTSRLDVTATVNTPPAAPNSDAGNKTNQTIVLSVAKLLARATGTGLSVTAVQNPSTLSGAVSLIGSPATGISYTAPSTVGVDSFTYTITDGNGCTVSPTIYVTNALNSGGSPNVVSAPTYANGKFSVTFAGIPNFTYTVEYAEGSAAPPWHWLKNVTAGSNGLFVVEDEVSQSPSRYYRTVYPSY